MSDRTYPEPRDSATELQALNMSDTLTDEEISDILALRLLQDSAEGPRIIRALERAATMKRELAAALVDAERYRWLRNRSANQYEHPIVVSQERTEHGMRYTGPIFDRQLDAAIDSARKP